MWHHLTCRHLILATRISFLLLCLLSESITTSKTSRLKISAMFHTARLLFRLKMSVAPHNSQDNSSITSMVLIQLQIDFIIVVIKFYAITDSRSLNTILPQQYNENIPAFVGNRNWALKVSLDLKNTSHLPTLIWVILQIARGVSAAQTCKTDRNFPTTPLNFLPRKTNLVRERIPFPRDPITLHAGATGDPFVVSLAQEINYLNVSCEQRFPTPRFLNETAST